MKLETLTIKALTQLFMDTAITVKATNIDRPLLKGKVIKAIADAYPSYDISYSTYDNANFKVIVNGIRIEFKVGLTGTGKYVEISKTRNKERMKVKGITFKEASIYINYPGYALSNREPIVSGRGNSLEFRFKKASKVAIQDLLTFDNLNSHPSMESLKQEHYDHIASDYFFKLGSVILEARKLGHWPLDKVAKIVPNAWMENVTFIDPELIHGFVHGNIKTFYGDMIDNQIKETIEKL